MLVIKCRKLKTFFLDLIKLYNHPELDPDSGPRQLQNKVQFDVRYYLLKRGQENVINMQKDTFNLVYDSETKITYVKKVKDELTKNHKEVNSEITTGFMPQMLKEDGTPHKMCPV